MSVCFSYGPREEQRQRDIQKYRTSLSLSYTWFECRRYRGAIWPWGDKRVADRFLRRVRVIGGTPPNISRTRERVPSTGSMAPLHPLAHGAVPLAPLHPLAHGAVPLAPLHPLASRWSRIGLLYLLKRASEDSTR